MISVRVGIKTLPKVLASVRAQRRRLADLTPVMRGVAEDVRKVIDDCFRESRDVRGNPWKPLAPATLAARRGTTAKILVDTARLRASIRVFATKKGVEFGTNVVYAAAHLFGREEIGLTARPFLPVDADGRVIEDGAMARPLERMRVAVGRYVATGEVT